MYVTAIVPAAGVGIRFGGAVKKQFIALNGLPILSHTLRALAASKALSAVIVVVPPGEELRGREALELARIDLETEVIPGGQTRQDSVYIGLQRAKAETDLVLIHDGVRPFVSREVVLATVEAAKEWGGAIAAVPGRDPHWSNEASGRSAIISEVSQAAAWSPASGISSCTSS